MSHTQTDLLRLIDMHTAGEPVRIIDCRHIDLPGDNLLAKRAAFRDRFDHIRKAAMMEPRGHADMYGVVLVPPSDPAAEVGAIFTHVSGYSSMCGHVSIALSRFLQEEFGWGKNEDHLIECPCGPVTIHTPREGDQTARTGMTNVPSRVAKSNDEVQLPNGRKVRFDVCYGGAYYAILPKAELGNDIDFDNLDEIRTALGELVHAVRQRGALPYETNPELAYLYGAILSEGRDLSSDTVNRHICWFGEAQIDRSPTGSGVSARLAQSLQDGQADINQPYRFAGVSGEAFEGIITAENDGQVQTQVWGRAYYTAETLMRLEQDDPLMEGFSPRPFAG